MTKLDYEKANQRDVIAKQGHTNSKRFKRKPKSPKLLSVSQRRYAEKLFFRQIRKGNTPEKSFHHVMNIMSPPKKR